MLVTPTAFKTKPRLSQPITLAIFGSTGSIGTQTLELVRRYPDCFSVVMLIGGRNVTVLRSQILEFRPKVVGVQDSQALTALRDEFCGELPKDVEFVCGDLAIARLASVVDYELMVASIVGIAGARSVIEAVKAGRRIALANKESLVCAGRIISDSMAKSKAEIIPIDSEHCSIFQLLHGVASTELLSVTLTASGGPFWELPRDQFCRVTPAQAVKHPRWTMGAKISIDSATLMNKALEVIEAHWLFGLSAERIEVVIHPQSLIHAFVNLRDGVRLSHLSVPDMSGPISYGLFYPSERPSEVVRQLKFVDSLNLNFLPVDSTKFRAIDLAKEALAMGAGYPALLNIANEVAVEQFMKGEIAFDRIERTVERALNTISAPDSTTIEELMEFEVKIRETLRGVGASY